MGSPGGAQPNADGKENGQFTVGEDASAGQEHGNETMEKKIKKNPQPHGRGDNGGDMPDNAGLGRFGTEKADHQHQRNDGDVLHEQNGQAGAAAHRIDFAAFYQNAHDHRCGTECHDGAHRISLGQIEPRHQQQSDHDCCGRNLKGSPPKAMRPICSRRLKENSRPMEKSSSDTPNSAD